ncbi:MAG: hypothetical protein STHCBS139747_007905 [Sporothrix thermara]
MARMLSYTAAGLLAIAPALTAAAADAIVPRAEVTPLSVGHQVKARTVNCQFEITADDGATCVEFASEWGLTLAQFQALNPTAVCPALSSDTLYCVLGTVTGTTSSGIVGPNRTPTTYSYTLPTGTGGPSSLDIPFPTFPTTTSTTKSSTKTSTTSTSTATGGKPAPTQAGLAASCSNFHLVVKGDSCPIIESSYGVSTADFASWNPALQSNCIGLLTGYYVCVGVTDATTSVKPTTTSTSTSAPATSTVSKAPSPLQPGTSDSCTASHLVVSGDSCSAIESAAGISSAQFLAWNTGVNADCSNIYVGYYVCVAGGSGGTAPTTPSTPSPLQPGTDSTCTAYHLVVSGDSCSAIESAAGITAAQFAAWNPSVNAECSNIFLGYYVCIGA